jgi:hypothetical protein
MTDILESYSDRLFQGVSVVALGYSILMQYLIIQSFLSQPKWKVTLNFNAAGEGLFEMLILFPLCLVISLTAFYYSKSLT